MAVHNHLVSALTCSKTALRALLLLTAVATRVCDGELTTTPNDAAIAGAQAASYHPHRFDHTTHQLSEEKLLELQTRRARPRPPPEARPRSPARAQLPDAPACPPLDLKVHIYPNETDDYGRIESNRHVRQILRRLREDPRVYTHEGSEADWFVVQYHQREGLRIQDPGLQEQQAFVQHLDALRAQFPYLNDSIAQGRPNHIVFFTADHGPGDTWFQRPLECPKQGLPDEYNPACPGRALVFAEYPGRFDFRRAPGTRQACLVCFQQGKDIRLPSSDFDRPALWEAAAQESMLTYDRYNRASRGTFFAFRGWTPKMRPASRSGVANVDWDDMTGRAQLHAFHNRSGWDLGEYERGTDHDIMRSTVFCYNPAGRFGGDSLRYVTATLYGCITVWISNEGHLGRPFDEIIPWDRMSVTVPMRQLRDLPKLLAAVSELDKEKMFLTMRQYWSYLFWGQGFFEPAAKALGDLPDAYEGLLRVLQHRINKWNDLPHPQCI